MNVFQEVPPNDPLRLLDVGCNVGAWLSDVRNRRPTSQLAGVELNAPAIMAAARSLPNVVLARSVAERLPFPDDAFDCVTCLEVLEHLPAANWKLAIEEMRRVLKPGGAVAATCYLAPTVCAEVDPVLREWEAFIAPYWTPERALLEDRFRGVAFPFAEVPVPAFEVSTVVSLEGFLGYLGTWSAARTYEKQHGANPLDLFAPQFATAWGCGECLRTLRWQLTGRAGRA